MIETIDINYVVTAVGTILGLISGYIYAAYKRYSRDDVENILLAIKAATDDTSEDGSGVTPDEALMIIRSIIDGYIN